MSNTPSRAEIEVLVKRHGATSYRNRADTQHPAYGFTEDGLNGLIDEVLAKWGTPQPENLGFTIENRAGADVVVWKEGGCRPATSAEIAMWKALSAVQQPVAREPLSEREAFEASQRINYPAGSLRRTHKNVQLENGEYICAMTQVAWEAWLARAALAAQGGKP